jgi:hypothetical protein
MQKGGWILEVTLVNLDDEWFGYVDRTRRLMVSASMLHDFANSQRNLRLLSLVAAFVAVDRLLIDDDDEGRVASRRVVWSDHLPFDNDMVRRAPFKKFNVRWEFLVEHELDPFGLARHGDLLKNISETWGRGKGLGGRLSPHHRRVRAHAVRRVSEFA